jgi:predicted nucleic acid-binding protein
MDIFVDTSVVYTDPFWKRNYPGQLLEAAKDGRVRVYIADVVLRELKRNFEKQLDKEFSSISSANSNIKKLTRIHQDIPTPTKDKYLEDFDTYYEELFKNKNIITLPTDESMFNDLLDRAIERKKPFTDNRSEFKDAVIWTTYFKYAKEKGLSNCHLLSNNKKDFTDNDGNLHPELKNDYDKFKVHITIDDFYKANKDTIDKPLIEFQQWIDKQTINDKYVFELLFDNETDKVYDEVRRKFESADPRSFVDDRESGNIFGGYVYVEEVEWYHCSDIEIDVIKDYAIISGKLTLNLTLELYSYNYVRDSGDDKFPYYGSADREVNVYFNFIFDKDETLKSFEVTHVE